MANRCWSPPQQSYPARLSRMEFVIQRQNLLIPNLAGCAALGSAVFRTFTGGRVRCSQEAVAAVGVIFGSMFWHKLAKMFARGLIAV
jgi:hypothetical protein